MSAESTSQALISKMSGISEDKETEGGIEERTADPGASRHGNFMNYYQFHPAEERVRQLPHGVWRLSHPDRKYVGLDIGCNAGNLTLSLQDFLRNELSKDNGDVYLLGVDIDPILIERAREHNSQPDRISFESLDFLSQNCNDLMRKYLDSLEVTRFDVIFCFSITMWIHLNYGDEGLVEFLRKACSLTNLIVIEPQPWKCYRNASRRLRRANLQDFPLIKTLKLSGDPETHIAKILTDICEFREVALTESNNWERKLLVYARQNS